MFQNFAPSGSICLLVLHVPFHSAQRHTATAIRQDRAERSMETIPSFDQLFLAIENHWKQWWNDPKTIDVNGQRPKNIQWWWFSQKNIEIYNGFCNIIDIFNVLRKLWNHVFCRIVFDVMVLLITLYFLSCKHAFHCKLNSRTFYCIGFSKPFSSKIWKLSKNHWGQCTVSPKIVLPSFSSKAGSLLQYQCKWK